MRLGNVRTLFLLAPIAMLGCQTSPTDAEKRAAAIEHIKAQATLTPRPRRRPKPPFTPTIVRITASPKGLSGSRFDTTSQHSKYLDFFQPLEPEAALIRIHLTNRERNLYRGFAQYPTGELVEWDQTGNLAEAKWYQAEAKRLAGKTERTQMLVNGKPQMMNTPMRPKLSKERDLDISVPAGYADDLRKGHLILEAENDQVAFPLIGLPKPVQTNVDTLPAVTHVGLKGHGVEVVLRRGMGGPGLAPSPADDPNGYKETHKAMQYTGAFFTTKVDPAAAPGKTLDLVMRLKRTKWSDQPGKWFVLRARDALNPKFEPVDEYSLSVDPESKMAEFDCVLVETIVKTERAVIPNVGELTGKYEMPDQIRMGPHSSAKTASGWQVTLTAPEEIDLMDNSAGKLAWQYDLVSPTGKQVPQLYTDVVDPLVQTDYVTDIQVSGQKSTPSNSPGEPYFGTEGTWKKGALGNATITICHLKRKAYPSVTLRLPLLKGGKSRDPEMYINAVNVIGKK